MTLNKVLPPNTTQMEEALCVLLELYETGSIQWFFPTNFPSNAYNTSELCQSHATSSEDYINFVLVFSILIFTARMYLHTTFNNVEHKIQIQHTLPSKTSIHL